MLKVKIHEECIKEIFLHNDAVGLCVERIFGNLEYLCPEKFLKLKIFIGHIKNWLFPVDIPHDFIINSIVDHLLKNALFRISIRLEEEWMTILTWDDIIEQHTNFIS